MSSEEKYIASPHYALNRLRKALDAARHSSDPEVRERAAKKSERWLEVISGMASGRLVVGSRTPVSGTPAWVTLDVAHGGFATGRYLAEGPLREHEIEVLTRIPDDVPGSTERAVLNHYFLSDAGQKELLKSLRDGSFTIDVPEEGALLTAVWLLEHGYVLEALTLLEELQPFMERLRFYPQFESTPQPPGDLVRRSSVGEVKKSLKRIEPHPQVSAMNEALGVWNPLFDRLLALWLETVVGEPPNLETGKVTGGRPGETSPPGWADRRSAWLRDYRKAVAAHGLCGKHRHPKSNFSRLRKALECFQPKNRANPRELGWVRRALANAISKRGLPGSPQWTRIRTEQTRHLEQPNRVELAAQLCAKLDQYPTDGGLGSVSALLNDLESKLRRRFESKLNLALEAPLPELLDRGIVNSSEVLAQVLPQLTSQVSAAGLEDPDLRRLFSGVYSAFKRRRSLLLLNLESQVRLEELPWIRAISKLRKSGMDQKTVARQTLEKVSLLALSSFPQTMVPNPLVSELSALVRQAGIALPLVEEVAADIFMGKFTAKWTRAAEFAFPHLKGTLYAHYYDLDGLTGEDFSNLCAQRATEAGSGGGWVARNGATIEQSQILTTQNLAALTFGLGLEDELRGMAPALATRSLSFVVARQNRPAADFRARLQMIKNTAYAWRQAIFFLSLMEPDRQSHILTQLQTDIDSRDDDWKVIFQPALDGLWHIYQGGRFDHRGFGRGRRQARRFLAWSCGHHWMMAGAPS